MLCKMFQGRKIFHVRRTRNLPTHILAKLSLVWNVELSGRMTSRFINQSCNLLFERMKTLLYSQKRKKKKKDLWLMWPFHSALMNAHD